MRPSASCGRAHFAFFNFFLKSALKSHLPNGYGAKGAERTSPVSYTHLAADVDELNFLAARLEQLDPAEVGKLNAALQQKNGLTNIGQVIDFTYNVDFYVHIPEAHTYRDLGDYYLNQSGMVQMPEEWKGGIDLTTFGRNAAAQEKGAFTEYGYIVESGDEWERQFEGREVPEEYRIMSYPQPERGEQDKAFMDAAEAQQTETPISITPSIVT